MDRMLYVAMTGAAETLRAQTVNNHNLANVSTTGFRADLAAFQSRAVDGTGYASRVYATNGTVGWDKTSGALLSTGRDLDVAINGPGWIAVQGADGKEAYTRAGNLQVDATGQLMTATGQQVLGDGGPINIPPYSRSSLRVMDRCPSWRRARRRTPRPPWIASSSSIRPMPTCSVATTACSA